MDCIDAKTGSRDDVPVQLDLFTGKPEAAKFRMEDDLFLEEGASWELADGLSLVQSKDGAQLILSGYGLFLAKKSERLVVKEGGKAVYEFPFFRLTDVIIQSRGISISADLIEELCKRGVRVSFLGFGGRPYAMLTSPMLSATVHARREQIIAFNDQRSVEFSKKVIAGKISNQAKLLKYFGKYVKQADPERFSRMEAVIAAIEETVGKIGAVNASKIDEARQTLMGLEGSSAKRYWEGVQELIGHKTQFFGREHRGAGDLVNALLNYGYGILYSCVWGAVLNAGLEPFAGFLHVDRPGKPSLVLDLVEEFRQPVVDKVVIAHVNLGEASEMKDGMLGEQERKAFARKIVERLETPEPFQGKKYQIKSIIQMQARNVASFLRGQGDYRPFSFKW
ncbi:MAG TPA: CRISPR-associated endonuclease Cas1 [Elusimicrobiota bacterium]|nr:CRISPR-associated endonuclease Cas1 [Elusimicrobiota bacterium]